jgi:paired small multidrug resistance pump
MGTAGTAIVDILVFGEEFSWMKMLFLVLLIIGILGLKLVTNEEKDVA